MGVISNTGIDELRTFVDGIRADLRSASSLEEAAQLCAEALYLEFKRSIVLARIYATMPIDEVPGEVKAFVQRAAASKGVADKMTAQTLVLTLLGTAGVDASWNDRRRSLAHLGIPLASRAFIESIPMISRLLVQLGADLELFDSRNIAHIRRILGGGLNGVFYVPDAATAVDSEGRRIIPSQDFVARYDVKTVFGMGGGYAGGTFVVFILFLREGIDRSVAERFATIVSGFKGATSRLGMNGPLFPR